MLCWGHHCPVFPDVEIGRNVSRGPDSKVGIESNIDRTTWQWILIPVLFESEVPLADHFRVVALFFQERGNRCLVRFNESVLGPAPDICAKRIFAGEQTVA